MQDFEVGQGFEQGELSGNVRLGKFEAHYEELFAEALEDGVITAEERARLEKAATAFGLDRDRVFALERTLTAAWEGRHRIAIQVVQTTGEEVAPSLRPLEAESDPQVRGLRKRIAELEAENEMLRAELEQARSQVAVEVDFSDLGQRDIPADSPDDIHRRIRHDPRDIESLHALFKATESSDPDRAVRVAQVLSFLGVATAKEQEMYLRHDPKAMLRPSASLSSDGWRRNLFHPDEEVLTGDIFAVVTSPVLLGRVTALRHQNALPKLDPAKLQDPRTSTVSAVRSFGWAASILGMTAPALYADGEWAGSCEMVPGIPPVVRLGRGSLSGRTPSQLAFIAGRMLASLREEHFVKLLFPNIPDLEDIFLAALSIGQPHLPLAAAVRQRAEPIAKAIVPLLEPAHLDRLRGQFIRFVEEGGRTNLVRWAQAAELTANRAGLLLSNDLEGAAKLLEVEPDRDLKIDDLIVFLTGDRCSRLRKQLGVSLG